jgi:spoIIIJ-associated protein
MNAVEAEGTTIEDAIANALKQLQVERDGAEIEVLAQPTKGFLGIGGKKARVRATLRVPLSTRTPEPSPPPVEPRRPVEPQRPTEPRRPAEYQRPVEPQRPTESRRPAEPQRPRERREEPAEETASETTPQLSPEMGEKACAALKDILHLMNTEARIALDMREGEALITATATGGTPEGFLIGHRGQTLDALEYLLNHIITKSEEIETRVTLDIEGYRERRWKSLESLALRLGERVKRRRKTITLSPMSPRDRRVIHLTLQEDPLVTTKSMGRGYFRQVTIVPEEGARREREHEPERAATSDS